MYTYSYIIIDANGIQTVIFIFYGPIFSFRPFLTQCFSLLARRNATARSRRQLGSYRAVPSSYGQLRGDDLQQNNGMF